MSMSPLKGMRVIDASQGVAGPYCGLLLAMHGADVLKVEPPEGDWLRRLGKRVGDHSPHSWYLNRSKISEVVDFRQESGRARLAELTLDCDVFISSMRPSAARRIGLDPAALSSRNPKAIQCIVSGYGSHGPLADRGAVDGVLQAFSGWVHINSQPGEAPRTFPYFPIDMVSGLYASQAVLAALLARAATGAGQVLEISLMQSAAAFLGPRLFELTIANGDSPRLFSSPNGSFRTRDGWFLVAVTTQQHFGLVCQALNCGELANDSRFTSRDARAQNGELLDKLLAERFLAFTTEECDQRFAALGAMGAPVNDPMQSLNHPQMLQTGGVTQAETPFGPLPLATVPGIDSAYQVGSAPSLATQINPN